MSPGPGVAVLHDATPNFSLPTMVQTKDVTVPTAENHNGAKLLLFDGQQRLRGRVTAYCPIKGFGVVRCDSVIKCDGAKNIFTQDVFLDRIEVEKSECELTNGAIISFSLTLNMQGKLQAHDIHVLLKGARKREFVSNLVGVDVDWNKTYVGIIRTNHKEKNVPLSLLKRDAGWGFIACKETEKLFGRDVWAYPSQLVGYKVGDTVSFRVSIDHWWSWPIALGIKPVGMVENGVSATALKDGTVEINGEQCSGSCVDLLKLDAQPLGQAWKKYINAEGQGYWWWCELDGDWFLEDEPGPWAKYKDPETGKHYWWKTDDTWFWV